MLTSIMPATQTYAAAQLYYGFMQCMVWGSDEDSRFLILDLFEDVKESNDETVQKQLDIIEEALNKCWQLEDAQYEQH